MTRQIPFECTDSKGFIDEMKQWIDRIQKEIIITMPDEDTIRIEYPTDIVDDIRSVNVDDCIYRLDVLHRNKKCCLFPSVPWNNREFFLNRWGKGVRSTSLGTAKKGFHITGHGTVTITYPK